MTIKAGRWESIGNGKAGRIEEFISASAFRNSDAFEKNGRILREDLEREIQSGTAFLEKVHQKIRG